MAKQWFECTVQFEKQLENGKLKKVKESYLVDSITFGEAEERIIKEAQDFISGEFEVAAVKKENISELFRGEEEDPWFKIKVSFITLDEVSGSEKYSKFTMYLQCKSIDVVIDALAEKMKGSMADYIVNSITETKIVDVFDYDSKVA